MHIEGKTPSTLPPQKNPGQAAATAESKAVEQFNTRGCADQEDDAWLS